MSTISYIRRLLNQLQPGAMLTTRDCLNFGRRGAVDQALYRLVKCGVLKRLTYGLFLKLEVEEYIAAADSIIPPLIEIVKTKAKAFHRQIFVHGVNAQDQLRPAAWDAPKQTEEVVMFATDGATTSFNVLGKRIYLKRHALRKVVLQDRKHALIIRALWWRGKDALTREVIHDVYRSLNREESSILRRLCSMMPSWMSDKMVFARGSRGTVIRNPTVFT
jgi:hypothetical protein